MGVGTSVRTRTTQCWSWRSGRLFYFPYICLKALRQSGGGGQKPPSLGLLWAQGRVTGTGGEVGRGRHGIRARSS